MTISDGRNIFVNGMGFIKMIMQYVDTIFGLYNVVARMQEWAGEMKKKIAILTKKIGISSHHASPADWHVNK